MADVFEEDVFGEKQLKKMLTESAYKKFNESLNTGVPLELDVADQVSIKFKKFVFLILFKIAAAMKEWSLQRGCTHFAHWFQPLHGLAAEKHDSFITFVGSPYGRQVQLNLTGKQLIKVRSYFAAVFTHTFFAATLKKTLFASN